MGKAIVYCGDCGRSLRDDDFERGRAGMLEGRPYCAECRALPAPEAHRPPTGSSARLRALVSEPPSVRHAVSTRRATVSPGASRSAGVWLAFGGGAVAAVILVALLASSPSRHPQPAAAPVAPRQPAVAAPASTPRAPVGTPSTAAADAGAVEAQMLARKAADDAARLDRFVEEIRLMIRELPQKPAKRAEIARMIDTLPPARRGEADRLRAELEAGIRDERLDGLIAQIREVLRAPGSLADRGPELRGWLEEAAKAAGPRQADVAALRTEALGKLREAEQAWRLTIGFEPDFEKRLARKDDWGGLRYTEDVALVHGGRRAVHLTRQTVGAGFWLRDKFEGRTFRMAAWSKRTEPGGAAYVGFEFFPDGDQRLSKDVVAIDSADYQQKEVVVKAPAGATRLLVWVWSDKKGEYVVDDVEILLKSDP